MSNRKSISFKDAGKGMVEAVFATLNVVDKDGDVTLPGFFGKQEVIMLPSHDWDSVPLGKGTIEEVGDKAVATIKMNLAIPTAKDWYEALKFDVDPANGTPLTEWSYGFRVLPGARTSDERAGQQVSILGPLDDGSPGVKVDEVSPVVVGAGEDTVTLSVKGKKTFSDEADSVLAAVEGFIKRAKSLADLRAKDGRCLSADNMEKIKGVYTGVNSITESLDALLVDDDADAKAQARRIFADRAARGR